MERGSDKHGAMRDEELDKELGGMLGQAGGHREDWREPELSLDDADADEAEMLRRRQHLSVAQDHRPGATAQDAPVRAVRQRQGHDHTTDRVGEPT